MNIVNVILPDNVPCSKETHAVGIKPTRWTGPLGVMLYCAPDFISLNKMVSSVYLNSSRRYDTGGYS